jgi:hypothetical protein
MILTPSSAGRAHSISSRASTNGFLLGLALVAGVLAARGQEQTKTPAALPPGIYYASVPKDVAEYVQIKLRPNNGRLEPIDFGTHGYPNYTCDPREKDFLAAPDLEKYATLVRYAFEFDRQGIRYEGSLVNLSLKNGQLDISRKVTTWPGNSASPATSLYVEKLRKAEALKNAAFEVRVLNYGVKLNDRFKTVLWLKCLTQGPDYFFAIDDGGAGPTAQQANTLYTLKEFVDVMHRRGGGLGIKIP